MGENLLPIYLLLSHQFCTSGVLVLLSRKKCTGWIYHTLKVLKSENNQLVFSLYGLSKSSAFAELNMTRTGEKIETKSNMRRVGPFFVTKHVVAWWKALLNPRNSAEIGQKVDNWPVSLLCLRSRSCTYVTQAMADLSFYGRSEFLLRYGQHSEKTTGMSHNSYSQHSHKGPRAIICCNSV